MFSEVMPGVTVLVGEVAGAVTDIKLVGAEMEVLSSGPTLGSPAVGRPVRTVPCVAGTAVLRLGRTCAVPEFVDTVDTGTLGVT